ncbi:LysM peptidoglycan-binding domain-containing M23 family metallopeptidase [Fusibacter bizertensis]
MGKKRQSVSNKHVYKKSNAKYYVKNDSKRERVGENAAKAIAVALYPFFYIGSKVNGLVKSDKTQFQSGSRSKQDDKSQHFNIKSNKLEPIISKAKVATQKGWSYVKPYKYYVAGAVTLIAITVVGLNAIGGIDAKKEVAIEPTAQHVVSIPKADIVEETSSDAANQTANAETAPTEVVKAPEFKVLSFASVKAYQLKVNGNIIGNFKTEEEANQVIENLKAIYTTVEGSVIKDVYFSEEVKVEMGQIDIVDFTAYDTVDDTLAYIVKGTKEEKKHVVQKGENYWVIAQYYGISPYDLESANPDVKAETLQIGQEISLVVPKPLVSVCTVEEASYKDSIAFEVQYENSSSLYKGETKTKVNGVYGERAVVAEVIKENGREIGRTVLSEQIVSQPQTKVVYKGTKDPPPKMGSGVLKYPAASRGIITSEFGVWRSYRRHTGIDIAMNVGSSIKAADGGVVTYAGYSSSYGKYIIIDHGGNMTTLYAHNSQLLVSKGEKIYQGQTIAHSGNTGNSTGPHLHFEVRINGVPQNPRNYVNF